MNKPAAVLAATTLLFAGTTLYFWDESRKRESADAPASMTAAEPAAAPASVSTALAPPAGGAATPAAVAGSAVASVDGAATASKPPGRDDPGREVMMPFAKDFLRQYDNPAQRSSLTKAARAGIESQYSRLREQLKLDDATFKQLVDLLTEEQVDGQANFFRCFVNPNCDPSKLPPVRDHSDEYLALLGAENAARLTAYRGSMQEWQSVVQLRGRLSEANNLRDSDAERLMKALTAERERYAAETGQAGAKLRGWGNGTGMMWYSGDGGMEEQMASATQYSERMRQSAATVLNAEQMRAFIQLQEELLAGLASYLQSQAGKPG